MLDPTRTPEPGTTYKHSGRYDRAALVRLSLISIVALAVLTPAYTLVSAGLDQLCEELDGGEIVGYLRKGIVLGCAVGLGYVVRYSGMRSKVLNRNVIIVCGLLMGMASLYLIWVLRFALAWETLLLSPFDLINAVSECVETRDIDGMAVFFETCLVLFLTPILAAASYNVPFCERCGQWTTRRDKVHIRPIGNVAEVQSQISRNDYSGLTALPLSDSMRSIAYLEFYECPHCRTFGTISISQCPPTDYFRRKFRRIVSNLVVEVAAYHRWKGDLPPQS
ncbi:MAG: hypothetical protein NT049_03680 [Planctomycetota bacterium]|nr:hypothetical protein [Planctomycetota bacterium]